MAARVGQEIQISMDPSLLKKFDQQTQAEIKRFCEKYISAEEPLPQMEVEGFYSQLVTRLPKNLSVDKIRAIVNGVLGGCIQTRCSQTAASAFMMAKEYVCFRGVKSVVESLRKACAKATALREDQRAAMFLTQERSLPTEIVVCNKEIESMEIPWRVVQLSCKLERLSMIPDAQEADFRKLIQGCFRAQTQYPQFAWMLQKFLDFIAYRETAVDYLKSVPLSSMLEYSWSFGQISEGIKEAFALFTKGFAEGGQRVLDLMRLWNETPKKLEMNKATEGLASRALVVAMIFIATMDRAIQSFEQDQEVRCQKYEKVYRELEENAGHSGKSVDTFVLSRISPQSELRSLKHLTPLPAKGMVADRSLAESFYAAFDLRHIPTPEEYRKKLEIFPQRSLIEECKREYERRGCADTAGISQFAKGESEWLPPNLLRRKAVKDQRKPQKRKAEKTRASRRQHGAVSSSVLSQLDLQMSKLTLHGDTAAPKVDEAAASAPAKGVSLQQKEEIREPSSVRDKQMHPSLEVDEAAASALVEQAKAPCKVDDEDVRIPDEEMAPQQDEAPRALLSDVSEKVESPFLVQVGDGPDLELYYAERVRRWVTRGLKVFESDRDYVSKGYSPELKSEILFRHSFGRALIPIILSEGKCFEKEGGARINFVLPGEIQREHSFEKVLFTVSLDRHTREIFHIYATKKTPLQLISEFAKDGCFQMDEESLAAMASTSFDKKARKGEMLRDDGSRVIAVGLDAMSVRMVDGTVLTVFPFPEI